VQEPSPWVTDGNVALLTDQYELTMLQAYWREEMFDTSVFSLFVRRLPTGRNYLLACGLDDVLRYLEDLRFTDDALEYLATFDEFGDGFLEWLGDFRFTGDVHAVPEGTPVFPDEPLLEVEGPLPEAQLAETFVMNQIHLQTVLASKAARVVEVARDWTGAARDPEEGSRRRTVVDFGLRRMHGTDAGLKAARAFHVAGVDATSNVLAGRVYGVPVTGTMAHSYIQAHDDEKEAFRSFMELYPETVLLVDTYDTLEGVRIVTELAEELGDQFRVRGIRLDSGDLGALAKDSRRILDDAGLDDVQIFASGGLDEHEIAELLEGGAPIDGFGVGTGMGVSKDAPALDIAYKLTSFGGEGRLKLSPGKKILPGRKQVFRIEEGGRAVRDVLARAGTDAPDGGRPLLRKVMERGRRTAGGRVESGGRAYLDDARDRARDEIDRLPDRIRSIKDADPPYDVEISDELREYQERVIEEVEGHDST